MSPASFRSVLIGFSTPALLLLTGCYDGSGSEGGAQGGGSDFPVPQIPEVCEGFDGQDVSAPAVTISGGDCNEDAIRAAVEAGGTIVVQCPDAPVRFTSQMVISQDTVLDGGGVTVLDGGGQTRLITKNTGVDLYIQNITLQNGQAPEALGNPEVTQANWFEWAGGAINAQCYDNTVTSGGGVYGKNLICRDNATGSHTRDPDTGFILDTGNGGCIYSFACTFHCDNCEFINNRATSGGAIGTLGGKTQLSHSSCVGNQAKFDSSTNDNQGCGGCYCQDGTETSPGEDETNYVHMCGNYFADNHSDLSGGAISFYYRQETRTSFAFVSNVCEANVAGESGELHSGGGCLYIYVDPETKLPYAPDVGPDQLVISANAIIDNSAAYTGGGALIYNIWNTPVRFDNNLFFANEVRTTDQSTGGGGAMALVGTYFDLEHNTFANNVANNWVGGVFQGAGGTALRNNLFWDNRAPVNQGDAMLSPSEHVNWALDESDDGQDNGFLVFASGGNLFTPSMTPWGEPRPTPGGDVLDAEPGLGSEVVRDDGFPYYLPLAADSPAVDAGMELATVRVDMRGRDRGGAPDIGAVEN